MKYRLVKTDNISELFGETQYRIDSIIEHQGTEWCTTVKYNYCKTDESARAWFDSYLAQRAKGDSSSVILEEREV